MKLKNIICFTGAAILALLLPFGVYAANYTAEARVSENRDKVTIDIAVAPETEDGDITVAGYAFSLNYDPMLLKAAAAEKKDVLGDALYAADKLGNADNSVMVTYNEDGLLKVGYASGKAANITEKTTIVSVTFDVLKKKDTEIGVDFFSVANDANTLDTSVKKGITEAKGIVKLKKEQANPNATGDAFSDNKVTATDAAYVFRLANTTSEYSEKLDMDNDGKITIFDAMIILEDVQNGDLY